MRTTSARVLTPEAGDRRRVRTPILAVTALAWLVTPALSFASPAATHSMDGSMGMAMDAQSGTHSMSDMTMHASTVSLPGFLGMWSLMLAAMMSPLLIAPLRHLGARGLPGRRAVASTLFLAAYLAVWSLGGLLLLAVADGLVRVGSAGALAFAMAVLWQCSPGKQRCLNRHHTYPPLPAFGRKADLAALRFGARHAAWCVGSCWALMLLPLVVAARPVAVLAAVTLWIWAEQLEFPILPSWRLRVPTRALLIARAAALH